MQGGSVVGEYRRGRWCMEQSMLPHPCGFAPNGGGEAAPQATDNDRACKGVEGDSTFDPNAPM